LIVELEVAAPVQNPENISHLWVEQPLGSEIFMQEGVSADENKYLKNAPYAFNKFQINKAG